MGYWLAPGVRNTPIPTSTSASRTAAAGARRPLRAARHERARGGAVPRSRAARRCRSSGRTSRCIRTRDCDRTPDPFRLFAIARSPAAGGGRGRARPRRAAIACREWTAAIPTTSRSSRFAAMPAEHSLTIDLPAATGDRRVLLLTGWTDYAFSGDNVAAHQRGLPHRAAGAAGRGRERAMAHGHGRDRLSGRAAADGRRRPDGHASRPPSPGAHRDDDAGVLGPDCGRHDRRRRRGRDDAARARVASTLRWRGFSAPTSPDGREPFGATTTTRVTPLSPWKLMPGRYTREGDVRELLVETDDHVRRLAAGRRDRRVVRCGALPPLPAGWTQTFLLYADGFSKEMDINSASPDDARPAAVPRDDALSRIRRRTRRDRESPAHREYLERYNTRIDQDSGLPPLDAAACPGGHADDDHIRYAAAACQTDLAESDRSRRRCEPTPTACSR